MDEETKLNEQLMVLITHCRDLSRYMQGENLKICRAWLQKLLKEVYPDVTAKRNRNFYLLKLVLCLKNGELTGPFSHYPPEELPSAAKTFQLQTLETKWTAEIAGDGDVDDAGCSGGSGDYKSALSSDESIGISENKAVIRFYDDLLREINEELEGLKPESDNKILNVVMKRIKANLGDREVNRNDLLIMLENTIKQRWMKDDH